jgi:hypothetical protein
MDQQGAASSCDAIRDAALQEVYEQGKSRTGIIKPHAASNRKQTTFSVGDPPMKPQHRICSIHHRIEVLPGVWKRERFVLRSIRGTSESQEGACPTCVQTARDLFAKQFPELYAGGFCPTPR